MAPPRFDSSPAVGTRLDEPRAPRAGTQSTEWEGLFPLQVSLDGCTNPEQEWTTILLQADVGVDDEETTTTAQAVAREEFARPPMNQQQRRVASSGAKQIKQFHPGG